LWKMVLRYLLYIYCILTLIISTERMKSAASSELHFLCGIALTSLAISILPQKYKFYLEITTTKTLLSTADFLCGQTQLFFSFLIHQNITQQRCTKISLLNSFCTNAWQTHIFRRSLKKKKKASGYETSNSHDVFLLMRNTSRLGAGQYKLTMKKNISCDKAKKNRSVYYFKGCSVCYKSHLSILLQLTSAYTQTQFKYFLNFTVLIQHHAEAVLWEIKIYTERN
jgi:hypothetical protein